jgi:hypothetical protein
MVERHANENPKPAQSIEIPLKGTSKATAAPLTETELDRVVGGYIGETEKNNVR